MIESQIAQLAAAVPLTDKGKIPGQPEDLETANLVNIHNAAYYYIQPSMGMWIDYSLPKKKSDLGRPVIPIIIGPHIFQEVVCDFEAIICSCRLCDSRNRWRCKGTRYFGPTFPKHRKSHHLCE